MTYKYFFRTTLIPVNLVLFDLRSIHVLYIKRQNQVKVFAMVISSFPVNFRLKYDSADQVINFQFPMKV